MRHRTSGRRLGMPSNRRKAMMKQLVEALFLHGRIRTTVSRAKETRPLAERIVTWAKRGSLHHRRLAMAVIPRVDIVNRIFTTMALWYKDRPGGYTRIIKIGPRPGDAADMAFLELVDWVQGDKLLGQNTKVVKVPEGEAGAEASGKEKAKKEKPKAEKPKAEKKTKAKGGPKAAKDPEKAKRIAERQAEKDKVKKERAEERNKRKQAAQEKKGKTAKPAAPKKTKPAAKKEK